MESLNLQAFSNSILNNSVERFRSALPENKQPGRDKELFKVCQDFEAIFIKQMLNAMKKTVPKNDLLNGGFAEEIFEDMLYDEYAASMAKTASFGLANLLYGQLKT
jgi:flagellar protein FlgJ